MQRSFPSNVKFFNEHTMACNVSHLPIIWTWKLHLNKNLSSKELAFFSVKACTNFKFQRPVQDVGGGIKSKVLAFIVCCLRNLSGVKWPKLVLFSSTSYSIHQSMITKWTTVYRQHTCISRQRHVADEKHKSEVQKRRMNYFPFLVFIFLR